MSDLIWLTEAQMPKIEPYFPLSHGVPRVDDRRIISGIIFCHSGRAVLARCTTRIWPAQDDSQNES
jgi:transposase